MSSPLPHKFTQIPELVALTMSYVSTWTDFLNFSAVDVLHRRQAQKLVQIFIRRLLALFLHIEHHGEFWTIMDETLSIITGDLPLALLLKKPSMGCVCDIITPCGMAHRLIAFLVGKSNYIVCQSPPEAIVILQTDSVRTVYYCKKAAEKVRTYHNILYYYIAKVCQFSRETCGLSYEKELSKMFSTLSCIRKTRQK